MQARFGALEQLAHQTRSEGEQATHCANQARHRAGAAQASADSGLAIIRALGSPPI